MGYMKRVVIVVLGTVISINFLFGQPSKYWPGEITGDVLKVKQVAYHVKGVKNDEIVYGKRARSHGFKGTFIWKWKDSVLKTAKKRYRSGVVEQWLRYEYDNNARCQKITGHYNNELGWSNLYNAEYDQGGNLISEKIRVEYGKWNTCNYEHTEDTTYLSIDYYSGEKALMKCFEVDSGYVEKTVSSKNEGQLVVFYKNNGLKSSSTVSDASGKRSQWSWEYIFDDLGNWIEKREYFNGDIKVVFRRRIIYQEPT
jgi:hypothetical protein